MTRRNVLILLGLAFAVLAGAYLVDFGRMSTAQLLLPKGKHSGKDYMLSSLNVTAIAQDSKKLIWIGTSAGINVFNGKDYIQFFHDSKDSTALPDDYITDLYRDSKGRMWVNTQNGMARYEGGYRFHRVTAADKDVPDFKDIRKKNRQKFQTDSLFRQDTLNILQKPKELISTVFKDAGGNLWVGFQNAGYQVISTNLMAYKKANNNILAQTTEGMDITHLATVGNQILAATTLRLFVYNTLTQQHKNYYFKDLLNASAAPKLTKILPLDNEKTWLVGEKEVLSCKVEGENLQTIQKKAFPQKEALGSATRKGDCVYIATSSGYLLKYQFGSNRYDSIAVACNGYDNESQLTTLRDGNILVFMKNMHIGILSTKSGKMNELALSGRPSFGNIDPAFARQDSHGNIWLGTKRYGLYRLDLKKKHLERMNFINDVHIQGITEDALGQLWITTLKDAICYQPSTGALLMNSLISSSQNEWNRQYFDNAICLSPQGNVVFGSSDGCIFIPPTSGNKDQVSNKRLKNGTLTTYDNPRTLEKGLCIYALDIKKNNGNTLALNDNIKNGSSYTFAHDENTLGFKFYYPNYSRRSSLMYQYKLDGYDKEWHTPTYENEASYANLPPGNYTFRLRVVSSPSLPPLAERNVDIRIKCAPWASAAAWLLYLSSLGFLLYFINSLYLHMRTNRLLLLQEQHEREREQRTNEMNMSFFANISHEFRNPITLIAGPLLSLQSDTALSPAVHTTLDRVCLSVNRMLRLIDQMLDFNQLEADALRLKVCQVDVEEEIRKMTETFEESAKRREIQVETTFGNDTDGRTQETWIDPDKMEKIMNNLFTNALKHTPNGGLIKISARLTAEELQMSIFNNGSHIEEDKLNDVFKRYYQIDSTPGSHHYGWGTGIGLYYVKRLVGLHHGDISVGNVSESTTEGERTGVEFRFKLPVRKEEYLDREITEKPHHVMQIPLKQMDAETAELQEEPDSSTKEKTKILIVDDDMDVAQYIRSIFAGNYIVENRYSAESALEDLESIAPDIILSDVIMGEMSGYEFCKTVKENLLFSHIPVVLITAKSNMNEQISGLQLGAVAYVTKPFDPFYLKALVEAQLGNLNILRKRLGESTDTKSIDSTAADALSEQDRKFMDELYALMDKRAAEQDLNVATVCHDLLISQSKFNYKLKQLTGDTPGAFFRKYKLNKSAQLLKEGKYNASEIAMMVGFSTAAHFSVAFKKQFGVSPSEFH